MSETETLMQEIGRYQDALVAELEKARKLREALLEAAILLEALDLSVKWELADDVKKEMKRIKEKILLELTESPRLSGE